MSHHIHTPLTDAALGALRAGDPVLVTGVIYAARDAAHRRLVAALEAGEPLPFDPRGQILYYVGPSPARPGRPIGSAGPTSSYRMDPYTPRLLEQGVKGLIGKGPRSPAVRAALRRHGAVYLAATGGAAALIAAAIKTARILAYEDLGAEALQELRVEDFPAIVVDDLHGGDAYEDGQAAYRMTDPREIADRTGKPLS